MNCPNCGAGLQPVGNRPYFRCEHCQTFHFPRELDEGVALGDAKASYDCPVCAKQLMHAAIEGYPIAYCQTCRGFLATNATFNYLVRLKRARNRGVEHIPEPFARQELHRRLKCSKCSERMDAHPYHAGGNAVIDTCYHCRVVWLDAGEITVIGQYTGRTEPMSLPIAPIPQQTEPPRVQFYGHRVDFGD